MLMEEYQKLCHALNALPDAQGRRIEAHYLLGQSVQDIAAEEAVTCRAVQALSLIHIFAIVTRVPSSIIPLS